MEEEVGFEPTVRSHVRRFSRPLQSTALALLQRYSIGNKYILHKTYFFVNPESFLSANNNFSFSTKCVSSEHKILGYICLSKVALSLFKIIISISIYCSMFLLINENLIYQIPQNFINQLQFFSIALNFINIFICTSD